MRFLCPPAFKKGRVFWQCPNHSISDYIPNDILTYYVRGRVVNNSSSYYWGSSLKFRYYGSSFSRFYSVISSGMALSVTKSLAGWSGVQFSAGTWDFSLLQITQTGPGARSASYWMNVMVSSSGVKGRDMKLHLMKRLDLVEMYSCSPVWLYDLHRDSFSSVFASDILERTIVELSNT